MRADVRAYLEGAASLELDLNDNYVALVDREFADELMGSWSPPVQLLIEANGESGAMLEITVREPQQ